MITGYHAKYYANELTCRHAADTVDRLSQSLFDASVDLNPHQIDAALFALRNPLQQGVLLADEVGLGKTIEAALVLCQHWAERRRRLVIVCPASLRKQWAQELAEKFALPSVVVDAAAIRRTGLSANLAMSQWAGRQIIILSYPYAARLADELVTIPWDLVVIDEAHKLRNAHRPGNRIGQALKRAFNGRRKILLTATPLQNSLMELYGLSTLLDEHLFGDEAAFRKQFVNGLGDNDALRERLAGFAKRTLRRQVLEYVRYTERKALTQPFNPTDDEHALYEAISAFLQREHSYALPRQQRHLTGLILRKLLASSAHAVTGTLLAIRQRLQDQLDGQSSDDTNFLDRLVEEGDLEEDYLEELEVEEASTEALPVDQQALRLEIAEIYGFITRAQALQTDTKAQALLSALDIGFAKMAELRAPRKVIIFTESRRTQEYLAEFLAANGYADKLVTFSGSNNGPQATLIYQDWLKQHQGSDRVTGSPQVDRRTALIDYFREKAEIMIATEAAAEGVNLQFCALLVNYDLPWNPQRVEQRIGRCHRYGQRFDVVVINFLNTRNQADQRVLELLTEKFQLFSGVFGASDEVLGRIESGLDFERRIALIYDTCRRPEDIQSAFEALQRELEADINDKLRETQSQLIEHFDEDVHERLRLQLDEAQARLDRIGRWFWAVTRYSLHDRAQFDAMYHAFSLTQPPIASVKLGRYQLVRGGQQTDMLAHAYRLNHPLGEWALEQALQASTPMAELHFDYSHHPTRLSVISELAGASGWLRLDKLKLKALDSVEHLIFTAVTDGGRVLDQECCEKLFGVEVSHKPQNISQPAPASLSANSQRRIEASVAAFVEGNQRLFIEEREKLEKWADDKLLSAEEALRETKARIAQLKRDSRKASSLQEQSELQRQLSELERLQRRQRQEIFAVEDEIIEKRDALIDALQQRLSQTTETEHLFTLRWRVV
ncbi:SNF2-related protein [Pseudomonas aeruginosa]|nr:SNF2-related protein [Pseudomonas aeruginosa]